MASPTIYRTASTPSLTNPHGLAVDTELDRLIICDYGGTRMVSSRIDWLDAYDTLVMGALYLLGPKDVCYYDGYLYVCDNTNHTVTRLRSRDLSYKDCFGTSGTSGSGTDKLNAPIGITHDKKYLYVCDSGNSRIMKLDMETLSYDSQTSSINGALTLPYGIEYKKEGGEALFISDKEDGRVIKCKTDFTYIEENSSDVSSPKHLTFFDDYLHVIDGATVKVLASDGLSSITSYTDSTLSAGEGIVAYRDAIFISDTTNDRISIWKAYNPRDSFTASTPMKFGGNFYDNPLVIIDVDSVIVGDTQEYGSPNRWKEENRNNYGMGWTEEDEVSSTWTEES